MMDQVRSLRLSTLWPNMENQNAGGDDVDHVSAYISIWNERKVIKQGSMIIKGLVIDTSFLRPKI